jgi:hypothetical protein
MHELERIEQALRALDEWAGTLRQRKDLLTQQLDVITRPEAPAAPPAPRVVLKGFECLGPHVRCWHDIDIHTGVLKALWAAFPEKRDAMAAAASRCGTVREYIAKSPEALFPMHTRAWQSKYSRKLLDGWYLDTNLNSRRMSRILPAVTCAAGLVWGEDVKVFWRDTPAAA